MDDLWTRDEVRKCCWNGHKWQHNTSVWTGSTRRHQCRCLGRYSCLRVYVCVRAMRFQWININKTWITARPHCDPTTELLPSHVAPVIQKFAAERTTQAKVLDAATFIRIRPTSQTMHTESAHAAANSAYAPCIIMSTTDDSLQFPFCLRFDRISIHFIVVFLFCVKFIHIIVFTSHGREQLFFIHWIVFAAWIGFPWKTVHTTTVAYE